MIVLTLAPWSLCWRVQHPTAQVSKDAEMRRRTELTQLYNT